MSFQGWVETLVSSQVDGTTLTAAAAASCLPAAAKFSIPANYFAIGRVLRLRAKGRISCVITTPGTARFDVRFVSTAGTIIVADSGALTLNVVAKSNVPWWFEMDLDCRSIGATAATTLFPFGKFTSEAVVGSPVPTVGGNGVLCCPVATPAVGTGFDSTLAQQVDLFFTQTVATGSLTLHSYTLESLN